MKQIAEIFCVAALLLLPTFSLEKATTSPIPQVKAKRIALLVGISEYQIGTFGKDNWHRLDTGADLSNIQRVLRDYFTFTDFKVLREAEATQQGIVAAFRQQLITKASPGDSVVFYYSGHGFQAVDEPGGDVEPDGLDEVLVTWVPKEKQSLPDQERWKLMYMRDDSLAVLLNDLSEKMKGADGKVKGSITVILDSCHSGSGAKGSAIPKGRLWNERIDGARPKGKMDTGSGGGWDSQSALPEGVVFISGSESGQLSYMMDEPVDGSALTFFLCQRLADVAARNTHASYKDIFEWVRTQVLGRMPIQNPQIEGSIDALLFGDGSVKGSLPYIRVNRVTRGNPIRVTLESGSIAGITAGSTFKLFGAGSDITIPKNEIGTLTIESVLPFSAQGKVIPAKSKVLKETDFAAARAVLSSYAPPIEPLRILIPKSSPTYDLVSKQPFAVVSGVTEKDFDLKISAEKGPARYQRKTGEFVTFQGADDSVVLAQILGEWRRKEMCRLTSPPNSPKIEFDMVSVPSGTELDLGEEMTAALSKPARRTDGGSYLVEPGDEAYLVCRNRSMRPLYVTVLYLTLGGEIHILPNNSFSQEPIAGDGKLRALLRVHDVQEPFGSEVIKFVVTTDQVDLSGLQFKKSERPAIKGKKDPLQNLLFGIMDGNTKGPKIVVGKGKSTWGVSELVLTSRAK